MIAGTFLLAKKKVKDRARTTTEPVPRIVESVLSQMDAPHTIRIEAIKYAGFRARRGSVPTAKPDFDGLVEQCQRIEIYPFKHHYIDYVKLSDVAGNFFSLITALCTC